MFQSYLTIAIRNLYRRKFYSIINIAGLTIGLASAIFIFLYVQDELGYDKQFNNFNRIYRVNLEGRIQNQDLTVAVTCAPMAAVLVSDFPEVEASARLYTFSGDPIIIYKESSFVEPNFYFVDSTFFKVFSWPLRKGNPQTALNRKNTVVLSEKMANKYFGQEDPLGKILEIGETAESYEVTGIMENWPENSHITPELLASFVTHDYSRSPMWMSNNNYTYVLLKEGATASQLTSKFPQMVKKYIGPEFEKILQAPIENFEKAGGRYGYSLLPIDQIHLHSTYQFEIKPTGSLSAVYIFSIVAVLLILIACINFMNLSTAKSSLRAREVAMRKIFGSMKGMLVIQFLLESIILCLISLILAVIIVELLNPLFNQIAGKHINMIIFSSKSLLFIVIGLLVGFMAGSYPAFFLSSYQPLHIFGVNSFQTKKRFNLRSVLVSFQLTITISLFISTMVVSSQMRYIRKKDLGYNKENVMVIHRLFYMQKNVASFKQELLKIPGIEAVSISNTLPGRTFGQEGYTMDGLGPEGTRSIPNMAADADFQSTLKLELLSGRWFSEDIPSDSSAVIVNEALVKSFDMKDPLEKNLQRVTGEMSWYSQKIIGVVRDFHTESLHQQIRPLVIWSNPYPSYLSLRIQPDNPAELISKIKADWDKFLPNQPFIYSFLDEDILTLYKNEQSSKSLFTIFSFLSIFIAGLGLLGIAAFMSEQRTKEIGIRKILGATIPSILGLMTKEIFIFTGIATILAWIPSYYFMRHWLEGFSYRIELSPFIFVLASVFALIIALATVTLQSYAAARANPADALHHE